MDDTPVKSRLRRALERVLGQWTWSAPSWLVATGRGTAATGRWLRTHKRAVGTLAVLLVVAGGGGYQAYRWWEARPKPVRFSVTGQAPGATAIDENAKPEQLVLEFGGSAARLEQVGKVVAHGATLTPAIAGEWRWTNDRTLTFTPAVDWAVGQEYSVAFERTLFPEHVQLETYSWKFQSAPFTVRIANAEFYQDPVNPKVKRVEATLAFSHPVNTSELSKRIKLELRSGKQVEPHPFTVSYDKLKGEAYIHSGTVQIPADDAQMQLVLSAGVHAARGGPGTSSDTSTDVTVPGMYTYFHINGVTPALVPNERFEPEQVLILEASAGVTEEEIQSHLSVFVLPKDLPEAPDHAAQKNVHWNYYGPDRVPDELLKTRVALQAIPTEGQYATMHSFKFKAAVGQSLFIRVKKGAQSFGGYVLAKDFDTIQQVPPFPKEVRILHEGSLLSLTGERKLSVLARGVGALRFEVGRVLATQLNHLVTQANGSFAQPSFNNWSFNEDNIVERFSEVRQLEALEPHEAQYAAFDFGPYLTGDKRGLFFFRVQAWDATNNRALGAEETRFVLVTDLGMLVKDSADGSHEVFVASLHDGTPAAGATVEILGKNGLPVASAPTDADGHASFPKLTDFTREKVPTVYVVRKGEDLSFMPFGREDRQLNFSRFDTGGLLAQSTGERLSAYLFSDRGLYRPGDTFHVAAIIKPADWTRVIAGAPLEATVTDPRGLEVQKQKISVSAAGFEDVAYQTEETSPTGNYQVSFYVVKDGRRGNLLGSTSVRVEEFLPDRMKISTHFSTERLEGWVTPTSLKGLVSLKNLFGTAAENRRVAAKMALSPSYPGFRLYKDYAFFDPMHAKHTYDESLSDGRTDSNGDAEFDLTLDRFEKATYLLSFTAEGYEAEGGRGVTSESSVLVSPMTHLVGFKADGELRYMNKGAARSIELIAIDPALKKVALAGLKAQLIEQRYVSVLTHQRNGTYRYQSVLKDIALGSKDLAISEKGSQYALPTLQPGDFVLSIRDSDDSELAHVAFSVVGKANLTRTLEKNAELELKLNRNDYGPGDDIELEIKAPYAGAGLITIERDRVYAWKWFKTTTTSTVETIRLPAGLEGNGYINVSFVRGLDSPEIFMSPLSYGVMPFSISRANRINEVTLTSPELSRPGEPYRIRYKAQKRGKAVVFAVDEGILQVAGYKTPDPLAFFFKKRALQVRTSQILDQLLPEFSLVKAQSAAGGDEGGEAIGKNLNPFKRKRDKPVAYWSGVVDVDTTEWELTYVVPDSFNGSLRVMAVAVSPDAVGVATRKAIVRGPFVLSPNAPTFAAPGDEFEVSVGVSNGVEGSGKDAEVTLKLQSSEHLEVVDAPSRALKIPEGHESSATFLVRAKGKLGSATLSFIASRGDKQSKQSVDLSVRPPVPYMTTLSGGVLKSSDNDLAVPRTMHAEYRVLQASASPLPLGLAHGLVSYLNKFPYGCTEQLVSQAFPAIVLRHRPEFGYTPAEVETNLRQVIRILRARQNAEGAFGFWSANSYVSDFQTVYALHFLTEAREKGYPIPADLLANGLKYLKTVAEKDAPELSETRTRAYALYVLTRNGVVTTGWLTSLRESLDASQLAWGKDLTAVYLAGTYKLLKQDAKATRLLDKAHLGDPQSVDYASFYDRSVYDSQYLYVLARHFPERIKSLPDDAVASLAKELMGGSYNTLSSAYAVLALDAYVDALGDKANARTMGATLVEISTDGKATPLVIPQGLFPRIDFSDRASKLRFSSKSDVPLFYGMTLAGFDQELPGKPILQRLEVQREFQTADGKTLSETTLGAEIDVHLKIRTTDGSSVSQLAIVDLLPAGFEVVLSPPPARESEGEGEARDSESPPHADEGAEGEGGEGNEGADEAAANEQEQRESDHGEAPNQSGWVSPIGSEKSTWQPEYADIREDRVVLYGGATGQVQEFVYRIKATNVGNFTVPPPFAESMYDPGVRARGVGARLVVKKP